MRQQYCLVPLVELGIYPAVDPLTLLPYLDPHVLGEEHYAVARGVQEVLQEYRDLQDVIAILGMEELSDEDKLSLYSLVRFNVSESTILRSRSIYRFSW